MKSQMKINKGMLTAIVLVLSSLILASCALASSSTAAKKTTEQKKEDDPIISPDIPQVSGVTVTPSDSSVTVRWEALTGVEIDGYCIYKSTDGKTFKPFKYSSHTGKSFSGLENGTLYYFAVAAYKKIDGCEVYGQMSEPCKATPVNSKLTMSDTYIIIASGEKRELFARLYDEKQDVIWESADPAVASVSSDGVVTGVAAGKTTIKATAKGNASPKSVKCTVEVDRGYPSPAVSVESRYKKGADGVWRYTSRGDNKATLMFTGDFMATQQQMAAADGGDGFHYDFSPSLSLVKGILSEADLVVGNLETTLTHRFPYSSDLSMYMKISNCNTTPAYLDAIKGAGYDLLTTANNHYCDAGLYGVVDTIDRLDEYNFMHNGTYKSASDERIVMIELNGIKIAVLNYNQKSTNGKEIMLTEQQQSDMLGKFYRSRVEDDMKKAKKKGAEFIIVCMHFGTQNTVAVTETQTSITQFLADNGADLIICAHPHVLQKFDYVKTSGGKKVPCIYSLGNFVSSMAELDDNKYNIILKVGIEKKGKSVNVTSISYTPCCILPNYDGAKYVVAPTGFDSDKLTASARAELERAHEAIVRTVGDLIKPDCSPEK